MATDQGRALVRNLVEYPLPARPGVKDYIFYLVAEDNFGYGWASRRFFDAFYKNHRKFDARSLERVIDVLHDEVTQRGVQQIRELILVTHANSQAMLFRILEDPQASAGHRIPYVNEVTLARLRALFLDPERGPQLTSFKEKRDAVVAHLTDESWVTIRACNFGNSAPAMYATYAFFGGRADVYAPRRFMHFGEYVIDRHFARLSSKAKFHGHLVRQHFLPSDRTEARKKHEIEEIYQPALFSAPHPLASVPLNNPTASQQAELDAIVRALNSRTLSSALVSAIAAMMATLSIPGWTPTPAARIAVKKKNHAWILVDTLAHEDIPYSITYKIDVGTDATKKTIRAQAQLSVFERRKFVDGSRVMLQLFLTQGEDNLLRGRIRIAGYATGDQTSYRKDHLVQVLKLLKLKRLSDPSVPGIDLKEELGLETPQLTSVTPPEPQWPEEGPFRRAEWALRDGTRRWKVKLENPATWTGDQGYTISLYPDASWPEVYRRQVDLADCVGNADIPGTELPAYFDRLTIDQLLSVVAFLRNPFKPGHSLYITHAQQALKRKRGFVPWVLAKYPELMTQPLVPDDEWEMTVWERQDKQDTSYEYNFNDTWAEVKSMYPAHIAFEDDLFLEEDFARFYDISLDVPVKDMLTDSLPIDRRRPTAFEAQFQTSPSVTEDKAQFLEEEDPTAGCEDFEAAIDAAMQVKDLPPDEIEKLLEQQRTPGGTSYFEIAESVASQYSFVRAMGNWAEFPFAKKLPWVPSSTDDLVTEPMDRILAHRVEAEIGWWLSSEGAVAADTALLRAGLGVLWAWSVMMVPAGMLVRIAETEADNDAKWERIGYVTAVRQWLRRAAALTYHANGLPDLHSIHVDTPVSTEAGVGVHYPFENEPYYIGRYYYEQVQDSGGYSKFIWPGPALKRGFDRGVRVMVFTMAGELKRRSEHGVDELLQHMGLYGCKVPVLINAGILDLGSLQAAVISAMASRVLEKIPRP